MPRKLTVSDVLSISKDKRPAKVIAAEIQVGERQVRRIRTGIQHKGITGKDRNATPRFPPAHDNYQPPDNFDLVQGELDPMFSPEEAEMLDRQMGLPPLNDTPTRKDARQMERFLNRLLRMEEFQADRVTP